MDTKKIDAKKKDENKKDKEKESRKLNRLRRNKKYRRRRQKGKVACLPAEVLREDTRRGGDYRPQNPLRHLLPGFQSPRQPR